MRTKTARVSDIILMRNYNLIGQELRTTEFVPPHYMASRRKKEKGQPKPTWRRTTKQERSGGVE